MTRREVLAALILLPAALTAVPPKPSMGKVAQLSMKVSASVAEFERQMGELEASLGRTGRKLEAMQGYVDELPSMVFDMIERGHL